jgi:hypothetical protein
MCGIDRAVDAIGDRIAPMVRATNSNVVRIYGIGILHTAVILAEVGDVTRSPSRHHLASDAESLLGVALGTNVAGPIAAR